MSEDSIYITVNHLDDFNSNYMFKPGDILTFKKDPNNCYDDEAIAAYSEHGCKCGYVANSVSTVFRGTYSAGRAYDKVPDEFKGTVRFANEESLIVELKMDNMTVEDFNG